MPTRSPDFPFRLLLADVLSPEVPPELLLLLPVVVRPTPTAEAVFALCCVSIDGEARVLLLLLLLVNVDDDCSLACVGRDDDGFLRGEKNLSEI